MKVIVRCPKNRVTKTEMEQIIESLFQENKDLRVKVGHLHDELANAKASVEIQRGFREEMAEEIEALEKALAKSESESSQGMNAMVKFWEEAVNEKNKAEERAEEYRIALMESDCRVDELEKQLEWVRNKNEELVQFTASQKDVIAAQKEEKEALEDIVRSFEETRKDYEEEIHAQHVEKREWMQKYEELKAQKEADDKKCEETCAACNELYEDVLAERNRLRSEVALLTAERDTSVSENSELIFTINELQDKWEAEHNLRVEAEKAYDKVTSEAYDMHQKITNLTIDNTRLENKVEELEAEVDTCRHNIDGYIEGNRRMRAEYEKKMETEQDQTKYWRKKHDEVLQKMEGYKTQLIVSNNENLARAKAMEQLQEEHNELEENFNELERVHKLWGEEIDRLRRVVTELQTNRFTMGEIQNIISKYLESFEPSSGSLNF